MDSKRIKSVMILILLLINIFFVYNLITDYRDKYYIDSNTIENAVQILSKSGINISKTAIPNKKPDAPVYEVVYGDDYSEKVAVLLSGAEIENEYSVPGGIRLVAKNGSLTEISDEFEITFFGSRSDRYLDYSGIIEYSEKRLATAEPTEITKRLEGVLSSATSDSFREVKIEALCTGVYYDIPTGYHVLRFEQTFNKMYIYGHTLFCVVDGEDVLYMEGNWTFASVNKKYSSQISDQINILFMEKKAIELEREKLDENAADAEKELTIEHMDGVFCTYFNDDKTGIYFVPAWRITYDDGRESVHDMLGQNVRN